MTPRSILVMLVAGVLAAGPALATAADPPAAPGAAVSDVTPPRLGGVWGSVSFWRPGEDQWAAAQVNTPLAPGDSLSTGRDGTAEIQIGPRAFVRARPGTQLALDDQQSDRITFRLDAGEISLDLRELPDGQAVQVRTAMAVLAVQSPGLYRARLDPSLAFAVRGGGRATVFPASGAPGALASGEEAIVAGAAIERRPVPIEDEWDRWNEARTAVLVDARSTQYVPADVYGAQDLDRYGTWSSTPEYGEVWTPGSVPADWAPYSTGRWIWDARYHWTWVDDAPWGWAPFHYGRWVAIHGRWAWVPGPRLVRPAYCPALVVFLGGPAIAARPVGWVALSWGEPIVPWWGPAGFAGVPTWRGWHGPHVVNNVVVKSTTVVNVTQVNVYRNVSVNRAVVAVPHDRFGKDRVATTRLTSVDTRQLAPLHEPLPIKSVRAVATPPARRPDGAAPRGTLGGDARVRDDRRPGGGDPREGDLRREPPARGGAAEASRDRDTGPGGDRRRDGNEKRERPGAPRVEREDRAPRVKPAERIEGRPSSTPNRPPEPATAREREPRAEPVIHTRPAAAPIPAEVSRPPVKSPGTVFQQPAGAPQRPASIRQERPASGRPEPPASGKLERPAGGRPERAARSSGQGGPADSGGGDRSPRGSAR